MHVGLVSGDQMLALADVAERMGHDLRVTRQQNIVLTGVAEQAVDVARASIEETTGLSFGANPIVVARSRAPGSRTATSA